MFRQTVPSVEQRLRIVGSASRLYVSPCTMSSGGHRRIEVKFPSNATVVDESWEDNSVCAIRFCNLHISDLTHSFFVEYNKVSRLEIGCAVSFPLLFKNISLITNLRTVRFGRRAFDCEETATDEHGIEGAGRVCSGVTSMEISAGYDGSRKDVQQFALFNDKVNLAMELACHYFPALAHCDFVIPTECESKLHELLKKFPEIKKAGCMYADYATSVIRFYTKNYNSFMERHPRNLPDPRMRQHPRQSANPPGQSTQFRAPPAAPFQQQASHPVLTQLATAVPLIGVTSNQNEQQIPQPPPSTQTTSSDFSDARTSGTSRIERDTKFLRSVTVVSQNLLGSQNAGTTDTNDDDIEVLYATPAKPSSGQAFRVSNPSTVRNKPYVRGRGYNSVKSEGSGQNRSRSDSPSFLSQEWS